MPLAGLLLLAVVTRAARDDATRLGCDRDLATVERLYGGDVVDQPLAARIAEIDMARDRLDAYCPSHQRRRALTSRVLTAVADYDVGDVAALASAFSDATAANDVGDVLIVVDGVNVWGLNAELLLDANRSVVALNSTDTNLTSNGLHRLVNIASGSALSMEGFSLSGGVQYGTQSETDPDSQGGCVYVGAGATFRAKRTTFENCAAVIGGAVYGGIGSAMVLENVLVARCVAGLTGAGVAAPEQATVEIKGGSRFVSCYSGYGGGGLALFHPVSFFSRGVLEDVSFNGCSAKSFGGSLIGPGLGVMTMRNMDIANSSASVGGGLAQINSAACSYFQCKIDRCSSAGKSPIEGGSGMFVFSFGVPSSFTFGSGSSITRCSAANVGGGIFTLALQDIIMEQGAYISDCTADNGGGGVCSKGGLTLSSGARIDRCTAGSYGGAVFVNQLGVSATFKDAVLSHNAVSNGGGGGAVAIPKDSRLFILRSELSFNTALSGVGGAIASAGGQVWLMAGSVLKSNIALSGGGALAFSVDFNPLWASGVANGRLFASGPRCLFLSLQVNFEGVNDVDAASATYTVLSDAATASVVDVRQELSISVPVTGGTFESNLCLRPARAYDLGIVAVRGGGDWGDATVKSFGPVLLSDASSADGFDFTVPVGTGFATHHTVGMEANQGERVSIEGNVASGQGGGLYVSEQAQIFAFETSFAQNVALTGTGGAAYLGTSTRFEAVETLFAGNRASTGGALYATADCAVELCDVAATNNSALTGGGFGVFEGSASVVIARSVFQGNHVASSTPLEEVGGGGGALCFASVTRAHLSGTVFESNYNILSDGGALYTAGSTSSVTLEGVIFTNNSAHSGNGGAVAVSGGSVTWTAPEDLCATAEVLVDYSATVENCGQFAPSEFDLCDNVPDRCGIFAALDNPFIMDRSINICAGCACPFDFFKYFIVKNDDDGDEIEVYDKVKGVWDPRGVGIADSLVAYSVCLKQGNYSLKAYDLLGQGWWGAQLKIHVHQTNGTFEEYAVTQDGWLSESSTVEFTVARTAPSVARNVIKGNSALNGGGGAVYWQSSQPAGLSTTLLQENEASYGSDLATQAFQLVSRDNNLNGGLQVALLDFYGTVVQSQSLTVALASVSSSQKIMLRGLADFFEFAPAVNYTEGSLSAVSFSLPALGLSSPATSLRCAVGYRSDPDLSCKPCDEFEYWSLNSEGNGECKVCEDGMTCGPATTLNERLIWNLGARRRWWRYDETATKFYPCPYMKGCRIGKFSGSGACRDGYVGPACSSCETDFYRDGTAGACKQCSGKSKVLVIVVGLLVLILGLAALSYAAYIARHVDGVGKLARLIRLKQNKPRAIIMYVNWQIIASAEESLETIFPQPYRQLVAALSIFEFKLDILPIACVAPYSYYEEVLSASLAPISIFLILKLWSSWKSFFMDSKEWQQMQTLHRKLMIIVMFFLYPTSSASFLKILRGCEKYQRAADDGYLKVDLSKRCGTPTHTAYLIYACLMVAIIAAGWPLYLTCLLFRYRKRIYPPGKNDAERLRVRAKDHGLRERGLEVCYGHYRPAVIYAVPCEMIRRVFMIGILPFCGEGGLRVFIGLMVCLGYLATIRETQPYAEKDNNLLAYAVSWVVFSVFLAALIIETRPFGYRGFTLGVALLFVTCSVLFMVVFFGLRVNKVEREAMVMQFELELRDREANADIAALKSARDNLRSKYEPAMMLREVEAQKSVADLRTLRQFKQPSTMSCASTPRVERSMKTPRDKPELERRSTRHMYSPRSRAHSYLPAAAVRLSRTHKTGNEKVSFTTSHYPCYVVGLTTLRHFRSLPAHEDALQQRKLSILTALSDKPNSASSYFISQNWETFGDSPHPDNSLRTKLRWLKNLDKHMGLEAFQGELHIWWDRISIPQRNPAEQKAAIASLCCYTQLCTRFVALVRDQVAWKELHNEDLVDPTGGEFPVAGALETYLSRGWCRLEIVAALAPKKMPSGAWRPGPRTMSIRYHHDPTDAGNGPIIDAELLMNPLEGNFTVDTDTQVIYPVLKCIADRYDEYEKSGSDAWDVTIDVKNRPEWLKKFSEIISKHPEEEEEFSPPSAGGAHYAMDKASALPPGPLSSSPGPLSRRGDADILSAPLSSPGALSSRRHTMGNDTLQKQGSTESMMEPLEAYGRAIIHIKSPKGTKVVRSAVVAPMSDYSGDSKTDDDEAKENPK